MKDAIKRIPGVLPYTAFLVVLFFVERTFFGVQDALLGMVFLFFARTMVECIGLSFANYVKHASLFLVMSLCSSVAGLHPLLLVLGSGAYMTCIALMDSDDYLPRNFFMLGLGFLLLEIYPIGVEEIPQRILATLFGIACTTGFVYLMRRIKNESVLVRDRTFIMKSFDDIGFQLINLSNGEKQHIDPHRIFKITQDYCQTEYGNTFRQGGVLSGRQKYTFSLLVCAEQMADMIRAAAQHNDFSLENERSYYLALSEVFLGFGKGRVGDIRAMIDAIDSFLQTHKLINIEHDTAWRATLEAFKRTFENRHLSNDNSTPLFKGLRYRLIHLKDNLSLKNAQLRFAIQLGVVISLAFCASEVMANIFHMEFSEWIPITAFTMMYTYRDETMSAVGKLLLGTIIGIAIFVLVTEFIPQEARMLVVLIGGYTVILLNIGQTTTMAAGTQVALTALYPTLSLGNTLLTRLIFVILAALVVVSIVYVLLTARRASTIEHKFKELERVDERLLSQIRIDIHHGGAVNDRTMQLMYYLHMNATILSRLTEKVEKTLTNEVEQLTEANYRFAMDAGHAIVFLNSDVKHERWEHLSGTTQKLRKKIDDMPLDV